MRYRLRSNAVLVILAAAAVGMAGVSVAHDEHATGIYKVRHDEYSRLGEAFKTLRDATRAGKPDVAVIRNAAEIVKNASENQYTWYPEGSGPKAGVKTRAKAEIWSKPGDFANAQKLFEQNAERLSAAAGAGDVAAIRAQYGEVGKTCKGCHDNFRVPES